MTRAQQAGIVLSFTDAQGHARQADEAAVAALLASLPTCPSHTWFDAPPVFDTSCAQYELAGVYDPPLSWELCDGAGEVRCTGDADDGQLRWPKPLTAGVYVLTVRDAAGRHDATPVVVVSGRAWQGSFERVWILAVQLYGLRSATNWGIGDFSDLAVVLRLAAKQGAAGVGLNPLHALFDDDPQDCSPYAPNSRLFLNTLYIDPARAPGLPADFMVRHADEIDALRATELVNYAAVSALKQRALRTAYAAFRAGAPGEERAAFERFRAEGGRTLRRFACFEVLRGRYGSPWWQWPEPWRAPNDDALRRLSAEEEGEVAYREYLQWVAERQLRECVQVASDLQMPVGLYLDVAVGVKADGFDAWNEQLAISRLAAVGAPPDALNTAGQNWGLAGFNAAGLEQTLFAPFRDMLRASMRHAGAIRLDHVLGLQRVYLIPSGFGAGAGVYVQMPLAALLGITVLESQAARCVVIGEDLGTVPEGLREHLAASGIWSYRVMLFERHWDGTFKAPSDYAAQALATFSTHDLPTFAAWHEGYDLAVKRAIDIDPGESDDERRRAVAALSAGIYGDGQRVAAFVDVMRFLSAAPSKVVAVGLEDLLGVRDQPNIPGTIDQHPNWRRKLPLSCDALAAALDDAGLRVVFGSRSL